MGRSPGAALVAEALGGCGKPGRTSTKRALLAASPVPGGGRAAGMSGGEFPPGSWHCERRR
jgi:hypothetical protein